MANGITLLAAGLLALFALYLFYYTPWRRQRTLAHPFQPHWQRLLRTQLPAYQRLSAPQQARLRQHIQLFLDEKTFYGCAGFVVDDRVRITIASHACWLIVQRNYADYDGVHSILVYPHPYHASTTEQYGAVVHVSQQLRAGEASSAGQVVLAWSECQMAVNQPEGPHNVILHEFAHQLDYLDGSADGAPPLSGLAAEQWQHSMTHAWQGLHQTLQQNRPWLHPYGATHPAEFFAVLTEVFFQQPDYLKQVQPAVYHALSGYYRLDPANQFKPVDP